ncbi:translation initiation factor IF-2-like [Moschus berezovskii]|uniref:translation initiation factor IF-2-like n=1 Tax=Moschus berezovskii TaxID=68408 RepID=UPI0024437B3C|nr:translation initiation factor IF-2-like [Moschus berezovskii]
MGVPHRPCKPEDSVASSRESEPLIPAPGFLLTRTEGPRTDRGGAGGRLGAHTALGPKRLPGRPLRRAEPETGGPRPRPEPRSRALSPAAPAPRPSSPGRKLKQAEGREGALGSTQERADEPPPAPRETAPARESPGPRAAGRRRRGAAGPPGGAVAPQTPARRGLHPCAQPTGAGDFRPLQRALRVY